MKKESLYKIIKSLVVLLLVTICSVAWYTLCISERIVNKWRLKLLFGMIAVIILALALYYCWTIFKGKIQPHICFLVTGFLMGIIYMMVLIPFSSPDEPAHFVSANRLANQMMGITATDKNGNVYLRESEDREFVQRPGKVDFDQFYEEINDSLQTEYVAHSSVRATGAISAAYLPQAIGIVLARLINANYFVLVNMGRLMNLLTYVIIVTFAIKLIPFGKWYLFTITQFPMVLELTSSYSYDTIILASSFLFVSIMFKWIYEEKRIRTWQFVLMLFLGILVAALKVVYLPLVGMIFLLPAEKTFFKKKSTWRLCKLAGVCVIAIIAVLLNLNMARGVANSIVRQVDSGEIEFEQTIIEEASTSSEQEESLEIIEEASADSEQEEAVDIEENDEVKTFYSLKSLTQDIFTLPKVILNTIIRQSGFYFETMIGASLGWLEISIPSYVWVGSVVLLLFSLLQENVQGKIILSHRIWYCILLAGCVLAIFLLFLFALTTDGYKWILGIQGRYFLPVILLGAGIFCNEKIRLYKPMNEGCFLLGTLFINMFAIFTVFQTIVSR